MAEQQISVFGLQITVAQLMLLVAVVALLLGYGLAVLISRRQRWARLFAGSKNKEKLVSNTAFIKGINYILSDKRDRAIEELTKAVTFDTETIETYVALGNLFRSKGEIDRAIRIRQNVILRPNLEASVRLQALYDLGLDYRQGGLYDRALQTFTEVIRSDPKRIEAYVQMVQIYEETRDWENAFLTEQRLGKLTGSPARNVMAHHQVELGKEHFAQGRPEQARAAYKKALTLDPGCVDAYLHLGDLHFQEGKLQKAVTTWKKIADVAPRFIFLVFSRLARVTAKMKDFKHAEKFLAECAVRHGDPLAHLALARLLGERGAPDPALEELARALELDPALFEARRERGLLLLSLNRTEEALNEFRHLLEQLPGPKADFQCGRCGFESQELTWRCPQCHAWDTITLHRHHPCIFQNDRTPSDNTPSPAPTENAESGLDS